MSDTIQLEIVTPEKVAFTAEVAMVIVRATDGDLGILPHHAPLMAGLISWPLRFHTVEGETHYVAIGGGFIEVQPDKVTILAASAELPEEIDVKRARAAKERAEKRLAEKKADTDLVRAEAALQRAVTRLSVVSSSK